MLFMQVCANKGETSEKMNAVTVAMEIKRRIKKEQTIRLLSLKCKVLLFNAILRN